MLLKIFLSIIIILIPVIVLALLEIIGRHKQNKKYTNNERFKWMEEYTAEQDRLYELNKQKEISNLPNIKNFKKFKASSRNYRNKKYYVRKI